MSYAIMANGLSVKFADNWVLNNISFEVQKGIIFGLLGPSGAGSSWFCRTSRKRYKKINCIGA